MKEFQNKLYALQKGKDRIHLGGNPLNDLEMQALINTLSLQNNLKKISLSGIQMPNFLRIIKVLKNNINIRDLVIGDCEFNEEVTELLFSWIKRSKKLTVLTLRHNKFTEDTPITLAHAFQINKKLERFNINFEAFTEKGFNNFFKTLIERNITTRNAWFSKISVIKINLIAEWIRKNNQFNRIVLDGPNLNFSNMKFLLKVLKDSGKIESLCLRFSPTRTASINILADNMEKGHSLKNISLQSKNLELIDIVSMLDQES